MIRTLCLPPCYQPSPPKLRPIRVPAIGHLINQQIRHKPKDIVTPSHTERSPAPHLSRLHCAEIILAIKQHSKPFVDSDPLLEPKLRPRCEVAATCAGVHIVPEHIPASRWARELIIEGVDLMGMRDICQRILRKGQAQLVGNRSSITVESTFY